MVAWILSHFDLTTALMVIGLVASMVAIFLRKARPTLMAGHAALPSNLRLRTQLSETNSFVIRGLELDWQFLTNGSVYSAATERSFYDTQMLHKTLIILTAVAGLEITNDNYACGNVWFCSSNGSGALFGARRFAASSARS
jgi:hypothetical protein